MGAIGEALANQRRRAKHAAENPSHPLQQASVFHRNATLKQGQGGPARAAREGRVLDRCVAAKESAAMQLKAQTQSQAA